MLDKGCQFCFMEVSSHDRATSNQWITFKGAIFSNITHDHLDYHKTFKEYIYAKMFFDNLSNDAFALSNMDDTNGMVMLQNKAKRFTYIC